MRLVSNKGELWLLICDKCGYSDQTGRLICTECGYENPEEYKEVLCAHISHNEPEGCGNPECFKYKSSQSC